MPVSSREGKDWTVDRICAHRPASILDVGVGAGIYEEFLRPVLPDARFVGVEVFEPYLERFDLPSRYDEVLVADVRNLDPLPAVDVVILGDVLEHLVHAEALTLWARARRAARTAVFLSLPIVEYPQGEVDGNQHEAHLHTWSHESVLAELDGIVCWYAPPWPHQVGAYEASGMGA
jgi:Methyltransferase domain